MPAGRGRPSSYTDEIADQICERLAEGESLVVICRSEGMPSYSSISRWLLDEKRDDFRAKYALARATQADYLADQMQVIADECDDPAKARLQIDTRKWHASKLAPKKYGDKVTVGGDAESPLHVKGDPSTTDMAKAILGVLTKTEG